MGPRKTFTFHNPAQFSQNWHLFGLLFAKNCRFGSNFDWQGNENRSVRTLTCTHFIHDWLIGAVSEYRWSTKVTKFWNRQGRTDITASRFCKTLHEIVSCSDSPCNWNWIHKQATFRTSCIPNCEMVCRKSYPSRPSRGRSTPWCSNRRHLV